MSYILATNGYVEQGFFQEIPVVPSTKKKNLLKWGEQYVTSVLSMYSQVDIIFVRNGVQTALCATPAMTTFSYTDRHQISQRKQTRDYLMPTADLIVNAVNIKPAEGDQIWEEIDGVRYKYELGAYNNEPLWRYSGAYRQELRMHTKYIDEEVI